MGGGLWQRGGKLRRGVMREREKWVHEWTKKRRKKRKKKKGNEKMGVTLCENTKNFQNVTIEV